MLTKNERIILIEMTRLSGRLIEAMELMKDQVSDGEGKTELTHKLELAAGDFKKVTTLMMMAWDKDE